MKRLAAAFLASTLIFAAAPAFADGNRSKHRGYSQGGHYSKSYGHRSNGHRDRGYRRHKSYDYGPVIVGALAGGIVLGHLLSRPAYSAPRNYAPARPYLSNCHAVVGNHYYNGRPARYGGTMCYDQYGRAQIAPGSRYFMGYLN